MRKSTLSMLVSLMLLLSKTLLAQNQPLVEAPQADYLEQSSIATTQIRDKLVEGVKCESSLTYTSEALNTCTDALNHTSTQFWQEPAFVISGFAITFTVGTIFGLTKCFGLCN
jgi:hypothetical protein